MYETYKSVNRPVFDEYFEKLAAKYEGTGGTGWAIYNENPKVAYRITLLPNGVESIPAIQSGRVESFEAFDEEMMALWNSAWGTRHTAVYNVAPNLSYVPDGFTVDDIRRLPYNRTTIYHLKWDQAATFRQALARRAALDRAAGIDNFVLTVWNGGLGTEGQTVMIRVSAESLDADRAALQERMTIRESYWDAFMEETQIMNASAWHIERHDQTRANNLSWPAINE
jgi:hypothetical protein